MVTIIVHSEKKQSYNWKLEVELYTSRWLVFSEGKIYKFLKLFVCEIGRKRGVLECSLEVAEVLWGGGRRWCRHLLEERFVIVHLTYLVASFFVFVFLTCKLISLYMYLNHEAHYVDELENEWNQGQTLRSSEIQQLHKRKVSSLNQGSVFYSWNIITVTTCGLAAFYSM